MSNQITNCDFLRDSTDGPPFATGLTGAHILVLLMIGIASPAFAGSAEPVLVHTMGKVGSHTIASSLLGHVRNPVLHLHFLSDQLERRRRRQAAWGPVPDHFDRGILLRRQMRRYPDRRLKVITAVRDPIAVQASALFHNSWHNPAILDKNGRIDVSKAVAHFRDKVGQPQAFNYIFQWFDLELRGVFGIDVFRMPFPRDIKVARFSGYRADALVLRLEDLSEFGPEALADFLDLATIPELSLRNVRSESPEAEAYAVFSEELRLHPDLCASIYDNHFVQHFYEPLEVDAFQARWTGRT